METLVSCTPREPLAKLDEGGSASILDYNLPQAVSYEVLSMLKLDIDKTHFTKDAQTEPKDNYWSRLRQSRFTVDAVTDVLKGSLYTSVTPLQSLTMNLNSTSPTTSSGLVLKATNVPMSTATFEFSRDLLANKVVDGFKPFLYRRLSGKPGVRFVEEPATTRPAIYIVLKMRMASYLGDYGAGQTLKTFSLLPGERTTISVRSYQQNEETKSASQSILDSYSESCTDDLQTTIESNYDQSYSQSETDTDSMSGSIEYDAGGKIDLGIVGFGADTSVSGSASSVNTTSEALSAQMSLLTSSVDHHVQTADTNRQIEINTETSSTSTTETEETVTRTLENINKSRVLNFVFRQLLQEYFTITYVYDVSFYYYNGYEESRKTANLSTLEGFLEELIAGKSARTTIRNRIYETLCNIVDYTGTKTSLIERVEQEQANCIEPDAEPHRSTYVRVRKDLVQTYNDRSVHGIILDVSNRIVRTPSVIVDSLLGGGEALDCYNMQLQTAAYTSAHLENSKTEQMLGIIDGIASAEDKAALYKKVYGECCDVPQSTCCCGGSSTADA